jgi:hypothetical protein
MEPSIRHVRFFNGQFLRQEEFREEQLYANHMRRRLNYALFENGVVEITTNDLKIVQDGTASGTNKRIRVTTGMAVAGYNDVKEGKEIIRRDDAQVFDLSTTFAGGTVWVTVNYKRSEITPVSVGSATENTRVEETAEVRLHAADPTGTSTTDGDPLIVLGTVTYSSMFINNNIVPGRRQVAKLRSSLFVTAPSIAFNIANVTQGQTVTMIVTSSTLDLSGLVVGNLAFQFPTQISTISIPARSPSSATIVFTVSGTATLGAHSLTITIPAMPVPNSATNQFNVQAFVPAPTVTAINRPSARRSLDLIITGTNFVGTTVVNFNGAPAVAHTVNSSTEIYVPSVPLAAQPGPLTVTAQGGTSVPLVINVQN